MAPVDKGRDDRGYYRAIYTVLWDDLDFRDLDSSTKLVFFFLRTSPDSNRPCIYRCYIEAIKKYTGLPEETIKDSMDTLCKTNWIEYQDGIVWVKKALKFDPAISLQNIPHLKSVKKAIRSLPKLAIVDSFLEFYKISMEETEKSEPTKEETEKPEPTKAVIKEDTNRLVNLWNVVCGRVLPKVTTITDKRVRHINARLDERPDFEFWKELFQKIANTQFLIGESDQGWKAGFDWAINPNNLVKIMEGNYERKPKPDSPQPPPIKTRNLWGNCKKCKKESLLASLNQNGLCSICNPESETQSQKLKELIQNIGKTIPSQSSTSSKPEPTE